MTDGELSRLKALAEAATPGPWDVYSETIADKSAATAEFDYQVQNTEPFVGRVFMLNGDGKCPAITGCGPTSEANAAFIAASREAVPQLVAEVERLREALENPVSDDEHIWIYERAAAMFRDWSRAGVRGQKIYPQDGIEYWTALAMRECLIARAALTTPPAPSPWRPIETAPKDGSRLLLAYQNSHQKWRRVIAFYAPKLSVEANDDGSDWCEYDEATGRYFLPEGWYECIDNWDDYSYVHIGEK
jgi:hypothetical protein